MIDTITPEVLSAEESYKPRPGLKYEVGPGIFGTMKRPVLKLKNEFKALDDMAEAVKDDDAKYLENKCKTADLILTLDAGVSIADQAAKENVFDNVVFQAVLDFFLIAMWRPGKHIASFAPSQDPHQSATHKE